MSRWFIQGGWAEEFAATTENNFYSLATHEEIGIFGNDQEASDRGLCVFECTFSLLNERWQQLGFYVKCYPAKFRLIDGKCLGPSETLHARKNIVHRDYMCIIDNERRSWSDATAATLVKACFFFRWPLVRLTFEQNELELDGVGNVGCERSVNAATDHWPAEKGSEDVHQHCRDCARNRRIAHLTPHRMYHTQIHAHIPQAYGMKTVDIHEMEVALATRTGACSKISLKPIFQPNKNVLPPEAKAILDDRKSFESPNTASYAKGTSAFQWMTAWPDFQRSTHARLVDAWHSRLFPEMTVFCHKTNSKGRGMAVISREDWSLFVVNLEKFGPGRCFKILTGTRDFHTFHVVTPSDWLVWRVVAVPYLPRTGLVLEVEDGRGWTPIEAAMLHGLLLAPDHLRAVCRLIDCPMPDAYGNIEEETFTVIRKVFDGQEWLQEECFAEWTHKKKHRSGVCDVLDDLGDALDEILTHDCVNESEVRSMKEDLKVTTARKLATAKCDLLAAKFRAKIARRRAAAKKQAKAKAKGKGEGKGKKTDGGGGGGDPPPVAGPPQPPVVPDPSGPPVVAPPAPVPPPPTPPSDAVFSHGPPEAVNQVCISNLFILKLAGDSFGEFVCDVFSGSGGRVKFDERPAIPKKHSPGARPEASRESKCTSCCKAP